MLESRSYYHPQDNMPDYSGFEIVRVKYSKYKEYQRKYGFKSVPESYDFDNKTIEVLIPKEYYDIHSNLGNKYRLKFFQFIIEINDKIEILELKAKNFKNAKEICKLNNCIYYGPDPDHNNTPNNYYKMKG